MTKGHQTEAEVIAHLSNDAVMDLARERGLMAREHELDETFADGMEEGYSDGKDAVVTAINLIRAGKYDDAIVTLERAFLPTWQDVAECEARYREVMGRQ